MTRRPGGDDSFAGQLAGRAAELLPGIGLDERLELLGAMDPDEAAACLAWLAAARPEIFDHALVRDEALVERLQDRLDHQYDDDPQPYCSRCGADVGIFITRGDAWIHYTGKGTAEHPVELYDAGHEPVLAWREDGRNRCCRHCEHGEEQPADKHAVPCHDGCNDSDEDGAR